MKSRNLCAVVMFGCSMFLISSATFAANVSVVSGLDRWMYPFAFTGGTRDLAPTFGAVGEVGFDNRDGQFLIGFDTATQAPTGLGAGNYLVTSITVRAAVGAPDGFIYDSTYDGYRSYLDVADPNALPDADAGRPIELHGVGFRNGFTRFQFGPNNAQLPGFEETTAFGIAGSGTRNAYALGYSAPGVAGDMSNSIGNGIESNAWSIGQTPLSNGAPVPSGTVYSFSLDMGNPDILAYVQQGLNDGVLGFAISSMHAASQTGGPPVPQWITRENSQATLLAPRLDITYEVVPEPSAIALFGIALVSSMVVVRRRMAAIELGLGR